MLRIYCKNTGTFKEFQEGSTLLDMIPEFDFERPYEIISAKYAQTLLLVIRDNGKGTTPDKLKSLNTIPHYLDSTDDRLDLRHGLGLMLVKEIILLHNGSTEINSQSGQGFETVIHLPYNQK